MGNHRILVVEDDLDLRENLVQAISSKKYTVSYAIDGEEAFTSLKKQRCDLVLLDVNMPKLNGLECLKKIKELDPSIIVIVMTAFSTIEDAVVAIKEGAYNYLAKPIKHQALLDLIEKSLEASRLVEGIALSAPMIQLETGQFVGTSNEMKKIYALIHKLAKVDTSVLIRGESGTGKELIARAVHFNSFRKDQKLVALNCSAIAENLFESELFGHEKGAFTGADQRHIGKFQYAEGGTLFLDEIGDLSLAMQVKLLRVLQEKKFTPVGSNREIKADVRIIAATNRNLEEMVQKQTFREDLFYRLNVLPLYLPPLRERKEDIEKLVTHFMAKFNERHKKLITSISTDSLKILENHDWPGNIRELENVIEHAFVLEGTSSIESDSLPFYLRPSYSQPKNSAAKNPDSPEQIESELDYPSFKEQFERDFIIKALKLFKGRINQTALHAKIPKKTLLRKLQKYSIQAEDYRI